MLRIFGLSAAVMFVANAAIAEARLPSLRPMARPERTLDGRVAIRPPARPLQTPHITRPVARPGRQVEAPGTTNSILPPMRPQPPLIRTAMPMTEPDNSPSGAIPAPAILADVVMVGDSITAGGRWARHFPDVRIANRGVKGDTAQKILSRIDGILAVQPKRALLMFGINDIYNGVPVERILRRYQRVVRLLRVKDIEVVIQSTLECSHAICGAKLDRVHELNSGLRALAASRGLRFVDINQALSDRAGLKPAYSRDGVHLNGAGYARWYAVLTPYVGQA